MVEHQISAGPGHRLPLVLLRGGIHDLGDLLHGAEGAGHGAHVHKELHELHR